MSSPSSVAQNLGEYRHRNTLMQFKTLKEGRKLPTKADSRATKIMVLCVVGLRLGLELGLGLPSHKPNDDNDNDGD